MPGTPYKKYASALWHGFWANRRYFRRWQHPYPSIQAITKTLREVTSLVQMERLIRKK